VNRASRENAGSARCLEIVLGGERCASREALSAPPEARRGALVLPGRRPRARVWRVSFLVAAFAAALASCAPQDIYLFDTPTDESTPPAREEDAGPPPSDGSGPESPPEQPAFEQPACESDACRDCVARDLCAATSLLFCHPRSGACAVPCDPDAPSDAANCQTDRRCDPELGVCVQCITSADCGGAQPACDSESGRCVECVDSTACSGATPVCDTAAQRCVGCLGDAECEPLGEVCLVEEQRCVQCRTDAQCPVSGDDDERVCHPVEHRCVECLDDDDCRLDPEKPRCSAELECDDD
jgi:hypothetical protein